MMILFRVEQQLHLMASLLNFKIKIKENLLLK